MMTFAMIRSFLLALKVLLFATVVLGALRLGYYLIYPDYFASLSPRQLAQAFLIGFRFDVSISVSALTPLLILFLLPLPSLQTPLIRRSLLWLMFAALCAIWALTLADLAYFGEVFRHIDREILVLGQDLSGLIDFALGPFWPYTAVAVVSCLVLAALWQRLIIRAVISLPQTPSHTLRQGLLASLFVLFCLSSLVIGIRGFQPTGKTIKAIDAFAYGDERQAALSLNGAFNMLHTVRKSLQGSLDPKAQLNYFSPTELADWLSLEPALTGSLSYAPQSGSSPPKNVLLIAVESLSFKYVDGLSGRNLGVTPYLDELLTQSRYWPHFYSAGQRSIEGVQSLLTSVPLFESEPYLGWGLELNHIPRIATLLNQRGYRTTMLQASSRRSFYMDGIAHSLGFQDYFGREDYPLLRAYPQKSSWGWDYETLMFLAQHLQQQQAQRPSPFFAFLFTGSTHNPFPDPGAAFHTYPHEPGTEAAYLNTVRYFDWSLRQFMDWAATQEWYQNTVFILTADHVLAATDDGDLDSAFHIPLIIYAPDGSIPAGPDARYASHHDILPTILNLTQEPTQVRTFGRSLLDPNPAYNRAGALIKRGDVNGWVGPKGWFTFTSEQDLEQGGAYARQGQSFIRQSNQLKARLQQSEQQLKAD
ncbi:MAG: LTA synthase family protein [Neisseriaceae bacterium]|nr:LTA synthase family protein [Neisseriaceae bacterium]MBP6863619.1 LTA synthase family protein [Neisseriaceae bacterium]